MSFDYVKLYQSGIIGFWYLKKSQLHLYKLLKTKKRIISCAHRRFGKGTCVYTHCIEECIKNRIIVRIGAPTQIQAHSIFDFLLFKIFAYAPELRPKKVNGVYTFENGSQIFLFGVADSSQLDRARGTEAHIIVCDEAGFYAYKPEYVIKSILMPQLLETNGQMIIISTPPENIAHYYVSLVAQAEASNELFKWTIEDTVRVGERTQEELQKIIEDSGGIDSVHFKREWMCELIPTKDRLVIPEAQNKELYIGDQERPPYLDFYVCMDLGLIDYTAVLFAYLDFIKSRLIIIDEYCTNYSSTSEIVESCIEKEKLLEIKSVYMRIGDCERQQLFDMTKDHDYSVTPITKRSKQTGKGFRDSVINQLRIGIADGKILISNKCINLITQISYGIWNEKRTDFERADNFGHLDALMALAYLYDNINWTKNPYPHPYTLLNKSENFIPKLDLEKANKTYQMKKLLGR